MKRIKAGFTLIELLVVIAIISIIAAMLFPVFAKVRAKGLQASCTSNEKQLTLAILQYVQDNDERLPAICAGDTSDLAQGGWIFYDAFEGGFDVTQGSLYPYVKNKNVYICPADALGTQNGLSYAMNLCMVVNKGFVGGVLPGKSLGDFTDTSGIMLLGEEAQFTQFSKSTDPTIATTDDGNFAYADSFSTRHLGASDITFLDGHAKAYRPEQAAAAKVFSGLNTGCN